ncbi:SDR family NAD(P)-dependent oxidoreductase [Pseudahrensia aquimaris]|uniref:SDR family NAD(P)-dependent oxidoreductase n=1 Tax=Pseudahrensia aquimaris TaxID=744461 RepID=A0ABW3FA97_9HYPH
MTGTALIIGAGQGLSASVARKLFARGYHIVLAARDVTDLAEIGSELNADLIECNAREPREVEALFAHIDSINKPLEVAIYNPSARSRGPISELDPSDVENALMVTAYGAFLMAHHASKRMLGSNAGTMLFTGASAGVKGFANSAPFAMGKFALRGLCQSLARELHPKGIHIGHVVIDGGISTAGKSDADAMTEHTHHLLDPDSIADSYLALIDQHRSAWAWEIELRPWVEKF